MLARLFSLAALGFGIAAVPLPFFEGRGWKLGVPGWFTGGVVISPTSDFSRVGRIR